MFFGRRGDAGFIGPLLWVCSGVVGFNVAVFPRPVRDIVRPARPHVGVSAQKFALRHCGHRVGAKKFAQHAKNGSKWVFYAALGELLRGNAAGGAVLSEFCRAPAFVGSRRASLLCRAPGSRALLLAVLTLLCAAKPYWWHGGQPAQATTHRALATTYWVSVRIKRGSRAQDTYTEPEEGLTARRRPDAPMTPRIRRRRDPEGSRLSLRAGDAPSAPTGHATSNT